MVTLNVINDYQTVSHTKNTKFNLSYLSHFHCFSVAHTPAISQTFGDRTTPIPPTGPVTSVATITRTTVAGSKVHMEDRKPMPTVSATTTPTYVGQVQSVPYQNTFYIL